MQDFVILSSVTNQSIAVIKHKHTITPTHLDKIIYKTVE